MQVLTQDGDLLILDAGTGIRSLGLSLQNRAVSRTIGHIFLSHTHWDHIQGLPFFAPMRKRGNRFTILGEKRVDERLDHVLAGQYMDTYLPFSLKEMEADILVKEVRDGETILLGEHTLVTAQRMDHPGGSFAYRVCCQETTLVYATDLRHPVDGPDKKLVELAQNADLLIHDAHFASEEVSIYPSWGHSSWSQAVEAAVAAQVKRLALYHYSPTASDGALDAVERQARSSFPAAFLSREGLSIDLLAPTYPTG